MDTRAVLDVSCLMLFEASGDSEIDGLDDATVGSFEEDEDDAESCSYGSSYWECIKKIENDFDQRVEVFCKRDDEEVEIEGNREEMEKAAEVVAPAPSNASEESVVAEKFKKSKGTSPSDKRGRWRNSILLEAVESRVRILKYGFGSWVSVSVQAVFHPVSLEA